MVNGKVKCPLFRANIDSGLCAEIMNIGTLIKKSAVPEVEQFTEDQIRKACDNCPYEEADD